MGASLIIGVDGDDNRLAISRRMGADTTLDYRAVDVVTEVKRLTGGGVDVAIEALGTANFRECATQFAAGRDAVQSRCVFRQAANAL